MEGVTNYDDKMLIPEKAYSIPLKSYRDWFAKIIDDALFHALMERR